MIRDYGLHLEILIEFCLRIAHIFSVQASFQPGGTVSFEHRNLKGLNRSILGSLTTSNFFNPQVSYPEYACCSLSLSLSMTIYTSD